MKFSTKIFSDRMYREESTVKAMVGIYCRDHHSLKVTDCGTCSLLQSYAVDRLNHCPFQEGKTSCKNCPVHCYKPSMKEDVRQVMRYAGPRMLLRHPLLTIYHFIDDRRKEPFKPQKPANVETVCPGPVNEDS